MKRVLYLLLALSLILAEGVVFSQTSQGTGESAVCLWPVAGLRAQAGKNGAYLEALYFGQQVSLLGDTVYIRGEGRMYAKVRSSVGQVGWVHRYLFEENAEVMVVTRPATIYKSPGAASTITTESFGSGELVAMKDFSDGWMFLVGKKKEKEGWVKWNASNEVVSANEDDVAIAGLVDNAMDARTSSEKVQKLGHIKQQRGYDNSPLKAVVEAEINRQEAIINQSRGNTGSNNNARRTAPSDPNKSETKRLLALNGPMPTAEQKDEQAAVYRKVAPTAQPTDELPSNVERVHDANTGNNYLKVTEKGSIYEVSGLKDAKTVFYGYHKTLPKGTKILINIPDNSGFVEVEIVNKLGKDRPHVIALSRAAVEAIYGKGTNSKNVEAELIYFIRE